MNYSYDEDEYVQLVEIFFRDNLYMVLLKICYFIK